MTGPLTLTTALVEEGFNEINRWPDGHASRIKESARLALGHLLAEDVSTEPLPKEEVLTLLRRARAILPEEKP